MLDVNFSIFLLLQGSSGRRPVTHPRIWSCLILIIIHAPPPIGGAFLSRKPLLVSKTGMQNRNRDEDGKDEIHNSKRHNGGSHNHGRQAKHQTENRSPFPILPDRDSGDDAGDAVYSAQDRPEYGLGFKTRRQVFPWGDEHQHPHDFKQAEQAQADRSNYEADLFIHGFSFCMVFSPTRSQQRPARSGDHYTLARAASLRATGMTQSTGGNCRGKGFRF